MSSLSLSELKYTFRAYKVKETIAGQRCCSILAQKYIAIIKWTLLHHLMRVFREALKKLFQSLCIGFWSNNDGDYKPFQPHFMCCSTMARNQVTQRVTLMPTLSLRASQDALQMWLNNSVSISLFKMNIEHWNCIKSFFKTLTRCPCGLGIDEWDGVSLFNVFQESSGSRQVSKEFPGTKLPWCS